MRIFRGTVIGEGEFIDAAIPASGAHSRGIYSEVRRLLPIGHSEHVGFLLV